MKKDHIISAVVAMSDNRVIGVNNVLPWKLPLDMKHFRELTQHHIVVMGRKTYESIGKALPNRKNFILTRQKDLAIPDCSVVHDFAQVLEQVEAGSEIFIIGGAEIYKLLFDLTNRIYLTKVHTTLFGDTYFPEIDKNSWDETITEQHFKDEKHAYDFDFVTLNRKI